MNKHIGYSLLALLLLNATAYADYPRLPDINLSTQAGDINTSAMKNKVIYIDFWASWCKPCKNSFPWLNAMQDRYKNQGFKIVAINLDKDKSKAYAFLKAIPANFTVAFDAQGKVAEEFNVQGMPSSYLVDRSGHIRARHIGFREKDKASLEKAVASLLKEQGPN